MLARFYTDVHTFNLFEFNVGPSKTKRQRKFINADEVITTQRQTEVAVLGKQKMKDKTCNIECKR